MPNNMMAPILPTSTKFGSGDKERGYIVKQNTFLKAVLCILASAILGSVVLSFTLYEVHWQRRSALQGAHDHRKEEHALHLKVARLGMMLQNRLKDELEDQSILKEYRARLYRHVGDYQNSVLNAGEFSSNTTKKLADLGSQFDANLEKIMRQLWSDITEEGAKAQQRLRNITSDVISEMSLDSKEAEEYQRFLAQEGESEEGDPDGNEEDEAHIKFALERFFTTWLTQDKEQFKLPDSQLKDWEDLWEASMRVLSDPDSEADMEGIERQMKEKMEEAGRKPEDPDTHGAILDQFRHLIEVVKIGPHRASLTKDFKDYKSGKLALSKLVDKIEGLIDINVLPPDIFEDEDYDDYN